MNRCCYLALVIVLLHIGRPAQGAAIPDTFAIAGRNLFAYRVLSNVSGERSLLIFLHGSVRAYIGMKDAPLPSLSDLLEGNKTLEEQVTDAGMDMVVPVVNGSFNWLEPDGKIWIEALLERYRTKYSRIYIAGFSDGGTGAYRYFYDMPDRFAGLWILNGYPQLQNYQRKVDYRRNTEKPVLFYSQYEDKVVPYEFLLTEYRRQSIINGRASFRVFAGRHELQSYSEAAVREAIDFLARPANPAYVSSKDSIWIFPPLDAFLRDSSVIETYPFRVRIGKRFGMKATELEASLPLHTPKGAFIKVFPRCIPLSMLGDARLSFEGTADNKSIQFNCTNYLVHPAW
jgi:hypothetical protein